MKTVSLELARELKLNGFPQEAGFRYCGGHDYYENPDDAEGKFEYCKNDALLGEDEYCESAGMACEYFISAPTADEILDELPYSVKGFWLYVLKRIPGEGGWTVSYATNNFKETMHYEAGELAEAGAKMYLYLKKEGLL